MRKFLVSPEGSKHELPPITFEEYNVLGLWTGANDMNWNAWLYLNGYEEAQSFNEEFLIDAILVLGEGEPSLKFFDPDKDYEGYQGPSEPYFKDGLPTKIQGHSIKSQQGLGRTLWDHMKGIILEIRDGKLVKYGTVSEIMQKAREQMVTKYRGANDLEIEQANTMIRNQTAYD